MQDTHVLGEEGDTTKGKTVVFYCACLSHLPAIHRPREAWLAQPVDIFGGSDSDD
jgi:hypothetical protein